jgi:hypothetical protein
MGYSRKQLEALGEPFGSSCTRMEGGRRIYGGGGGGDSPDPEAMAQASANVRAKRVQAGTKAVDDVFNPMFNEQWEQGIRSKYLDFYMPQLEDQYKKARGQLEMNLAQANPYGSSANADAFADLDGSYQDQYNQILTGADDWMNSARQRVESARLAANQGAGDYDMSTMGRNAVSQARIAGTAPTMSPLAQLFANMTNPIGTAIAANSINGGGMFENKTGGPSTPGAKKTNAVQNIG